jgi:hypothetical protein
MEAAWIGGQVSRVEIQPFGDSVRRNPEKPIKRK